jgi:hypothetical protein
LNHRGWTKRPLREGLGDMLPKAIKHRRSKFSFETPQDQWLCGTLRPVIQRWLRSDRPIWDCTQRERVEELAGQTWESEGRRREIGQMLLRIYWFDQWLGLFGVGF